MIVLAEPDLPAELLRHRRCRSVGDLDEGIGDVGDEVLDLGRRLVAVIDAGPHDQRVLRIGDDLRAVDLELQRARQRHEDHRELVRVHGTRLRGLARVDELDLGGGERAIEPARHCITSYTFTRRR